MEFQAAGPFTSCRTAVLVLLQTNSSIIYSPHILSIIAHLAISLVHIHPETCHNVCWQSIAISRGRLPPIDVLHVGIIPLFFDDFSVVTGRRQRWVDELSFLVCHFDTANALIVSHLQIPPPLPLFADIE